MYLSRVALNTRRKETMGAIASPHLLHGAIERSFDNHTKNRQRNLWRIDWLKGVCYLIVLSKERPDMAHIVKQYGYQNNIHQWESKEYKLLLDRLKVGDIWNFRLMANPTRSSLKEKKETSNRGIVFAHVTQDQQRQWLLSRAEKRGFFLRKEQFDVVHTDWKKFSKNGLEKCHISLHIAIYEGVLTIKDLDLFKDALIKGVGRGKAYGCGLLTIARQKDCQL